MIEPTLNGFIDFVNNQDVDRLINHTNWNWYTCAVGDYAVTIDNKFIINNIVNILEEDAPDLYDYLNNGQGDTYGELQEFIKTL